MRTLLRRRPADTRQPRTSTRRRVAAIGATIAALTGGLLMAGAPTAAASGVCGSSYRLIDTYRLTSDAGKTGGYMYLYWNPNGFNCAVAKPIAAWAGDVNDITVSIQRADNTGNDADGTHGENYHYYAGPVYVYAPHTCLDLTGGFIHNHRDYLNVSEAGVHCG